VKKWKCFEVEWRTDVDEKWKWTAESATRNSKWLRTLRIISSSVKETGLAEAAAAAEEKATS
jgi:hypothetical protein